MTRRVLALLLIAAAAGAAQVQPVKLIAHRGGIVDAAHPENSPGSLEAAIERGYWMAEIDVRESKDGKLIVQHDPDFRRFYGVDRKVADMTWAEIERLRATPGDTRPMQFHEIAKLARNRIRLMIDTKESDHPKAFYDEMERALTENRLLEEAYFIGTEESHQYFRGKARISVNRAELQAALDRGEDCSRRCFLFEHGTTLDEAGLKLAARTKVPAVVSINDFHYAGRDHMAGARADILRLRKAGLTYFQIDSVYDIWLQ